MVRKEDTNTTTIHSHFDGDDDKDSFLGLEIGEKEVEDENALFEKGRNHGSKKGVINNGPSKMIIGGVEINYLFTVLLFMIGIEIILILAFSVMLVIRNKDSSSNNNDNEILITANNTDDTQNENLPGNSSSLDDNRGNEIGGDDINFDDVNGGFIMDGLAPIIPPCNTSAIIEIPPTCQSFAREWLNATTTTTTELSTMRLNQRYAMTVFYCELGGHYWHEYSQWLSDSHECEWYNNNGIDSNDHYPCDEEGRLQVLRLPDNSLSGTLPQELSLLTSLTELDLAYNCNISGTFPSSLSELKELETFYLSATSINDAPLPDFLLQFPDMKDLRLNEMWISGTLPTDLSYYMPDLTILHLQNNYLSFEIPSSIGQLKMTELRLKNNNFSGTIPPKICNLTSVERLYLHGNNLSGNIPQELEVAAGEGQLSRATFHWNVLEGVIPEGICERVYSSNRPMYLHVDCTSIACECCTCGCGEYDEAACYRPEYEHLFPDSMSFCTRSLT